MGCGPSTPTKVAPSLPIPSSIEADEPINDTISRLSSTCSVEESSRSSSSVTTTKTNEISGSTDVSASKSTTSTTPPPPLVESDSFKSRFAALREMSTRTLQSLTGSRSLSSSTSVRSIQTDRTTSKKVGGFLLRTFLGKATEVHEKEAAPTVEIVNREVKVKDESSGKKYVNQYLMIETIGKGANGKVKKCLDEKTGSYLAMKIIRRSINKRRRAPARPGAAPAVPEVNSEIAVWKKLKHPFIVKLYEVIDDEKSDKLYLIGELVNGGALMPDAITAEALPVDKVRRYFCMLIDAIYYLHFNDIVHRDIKPGNILLDRDTDAIKLSDFGVSQVTQAGDSFRNTAGTAAFLAPEMLTGDFFSAKKQDIWACGITLFMMVYGKTPFAADSVTDTYANIKSGKIVFPTETSSHDPIDPTSVEELNDLITHLLDPNPETRYSLEETRAHPFLHAVEPLFNLLPSKRIIVTEEEVSAAVTTVHHIRSVVTAAILGKRSLNAARMRIALKKSLAVSAFEDSSSVSSPSSPTASPTLSAAMSTSERVEAFAGLMSTRDKNDNDSASISSTEDPALHEKSNSSISYSDDSSSRSSMSSLSLGERNSAILEDSH